MVRSAAAVVAVLILPTFTQAQEPQAQEPQGTHEVVRGNTLWDLAAFYYENPFEWRVIFEANRDVVEDPHWIYPTEMLVIPGIPGTPTPETLFPGDPQDPEADPEDPEPDPETPEDDPTPETTPDVEDVPEELIQFGFRRARPAEEVRTIFYRDTTENQSRVVQAAQQAYAPVSADAVYSAPWLIGLEGDPEHSGVLEGFADRGNRASTIRSYQRVRVAMPAPARVGANLQIFRVSRSIDLVGQVVQPTGVLNVATIGDGFVVGVITKEYDRVQPGDFVRPLPAYDLAAGDRAEEVSGGSEAMVMGFAGTHRITDLGHIAFLDLGSDDGITIGDEFVLYGEAVPTSREGSLQVIGVADNTAAARVLSMADNVFQQGVIVRLHKKMR